MVGIVGSSVTFWSRHVKILSQFLEKKAHFKSLIFNKNMTVSLYRRCVRAYKNCKKNVKEDLDVKIKYSVPTEVIAKLVELGLASDIQDAYDLVEKGVAEDLIKEAEAKKEK